jgi:excisionase family DNA binding protein
MPKIVNEEPLLLTPEEVADLLRVTREEALGLMQDGDLAGMQIAGQWRIRADSVNDFLSHGLQRKNLRMLDRELNNPARWAIMLQEFPELAAKIEQGDHELDSFGFFLKGALQKTGAGTEEKRAMGTIVLHHGSGAQDFEIVGPSWGPEEAKRTVFNARRLLTARGHPAAVTLLESVHSPPFRQLTTSMTNFMFFMRIFRS